MALRASSAIRYHLPLSSGFFERPTHLPRSYRLDHTADERPRRPVPVLQGLAPVRGRLRLIAGVVGHSPQPTNLWLRRVRYRLKVLALELLAACAAVGDPLGVGFACFPIVEKDPIVLFSGPPEFSPDLGLLLARTI